MSRTTYTVGPMPGDSSRWKVESNGRVISKHNKKTRAVARAKDLKDRNDTLTIKDRNGRFLKRL